MTSLAEFSLWLAVAFPLVFSAGPGNVLCAVCGATNGFAKSIPFLLGLNTVYFFYALLAGYGFATVVTTYPVLFFFIQVAGAIYIGWLGTKFMQQSKLPPGSASVLRLSFIDGVISQALNIKGIAIVLTMFSEFLDTDTSLHFEVITYSGALLILNLFSHAVWSYGGAWIAKNFIYEAALHLQNIIYSIMLILVAFWLLNKNFLPSVG